MKIAIHGRPFREEANVFIQAMFDYLAHLGLEVQLHQPFKSFLIKNNVLIKDYPTYSSQESLFDADVVFSVGGDGTLLEALTIIGKKEIPVLGINLGRLGFLATTAREQIVQAIDDLMQKKYKIKSRSVISLDDGESIFNGINFGLNEFALLKRDTSSMIVVHTYIDGEYLNSYWADGLIVSTPTGSTGYNLSVGGPLMVPSCSNFIISPVSPHNLNVRPMVVSDESVLSFEVESRSNSFLVALDSRSVKVPLGMKFSVRKADFSLKMVELEKYDYFNTLRSRLNWGLDLRN